MTLHVLLDTHGNGCFVPNLAFDAGWETRYLSGPLCACLRIDSVTGADGLFYAEELAGRDGVDVTLTTEPTTTAEQLAEAKRTVRQARDVVCLDVVRIRRFY